MNPKTSMTKEEQQTNLKAALADKTIRRWVIGAGSLWVLLGAWLVYQTVTGQF